MHKKTVKQFFIYAFGALVLRSVNVFLAPLTMRILTPADYGLLSLAYNFISVFVVFAGFGLRQVFGLEFFHHQGSARYSMANDIVLLYLLLSFPLFFFACCSIRYINQFLFLNTAPFLLIPIILGICFFYFFVELLYQILQYQSKAIILTTLQISAALATIGINLFFLLIMQTGYLSPLIAQLMVMIGVSSLGLYWYFKKRVFNHIHKEQLYTRARIYLTQGLPFIPSILCSWILSSSDRWILAHYGSLHDVGIYSLADTFGQLFTLVVLYPMSGSYIPIMLAAFAQNKNNTQHLVQQNIRLMWYCISATALIITIGFLTGRWFLFWILPPAYHETISYIWLLLMGYVFLMGTYFNTIPLQFYKHTYFLSASLVLPALLNVALNMLLVPHYAILGSVIATVISYALYFVITLWYSMQKYYYFSA